MIKHRTNGKIVLSHLDAVCAKGLDHTMTQICDDIEKDEFEIHIFGGYEDEKDISEELSLGLLKYLFRSRYR